VVVGLGDPKMLDAGVFISSAVSLVLCPRSLNDLMLSLSAASAHTFTLGFRILTGITTGKCYASRLGFRIPHCGYGCAQVQLKENSGPYFTSRFPDSAPRVWVCTVKT
jgi:hypothetical protein